MKILCLILCLILCFYCGKLKNNERDLNPYCYQTDGKVELKYNRTIKTDESCYKIGMIQPHTTQNAIDRSENLILKDRNNHIYTRFNSEGKFIGIIGKHGRGPGEYLNPYSPFVDSKNILYLFDSSKLGTIAFDSLGNYLYEIKYDSGYDDNSMYLIKDCMKCIGLRMWEKKVWDYSAVSNFFILNDDHTVKSKFVIRYPNLFFDISNLSSLSGYSYDFNNEYVFFSFDPLPYIYKYDFNGKLISILGKKPIDFNIVDQENKSNSNPMDIQKFASKFSTMTDMVIFKNQFILAIYYNTSKEFMTSESKNPEEVYKFRKYSFLIYTLDGGIINSSDNSIKGTPIIIDRYNSRIYTLINDEPDNREIAVYDIVIKNL